MASLKITYDILVPLNTVRSMNLTLIMTLTIDSVLLV